MQFVERGVDVLAVEPDTRMASVAQAKGIPVEIAAFEQWEPAGRRFDRVVFAASISLGGSGGGAAEDTWHPRRWQGSWR